MANPQDTLVIRVRGIGERTDKTQMLNGVTSRMPRFRVYDLPWPAQYGSPMPFNQGLREWTPRLIDYVANKVEGRCIILGFSGGAQLAGDAVAAMPDEVLAKVAGLGLVSDPSTPIGEVYPGLGGIRASRPVDGVPVLWKADRADFICSTNNKLLRFIATRSGDFGLGNARTVEAAPRVHLSKVVARTIPEPPPNINELIAAPVVLDALRGLGGYLHRGDHTGYGIRREGTTGRTYLDNLARWAVSL